MEATTMARDYANISVVVPNMENFIEADGKPKSITSKIQKFGGLAWQLKIRKVLKPDKLKLYIRCNDNEDVNVNVKDHLWLCNANLELLTAQEDGAGQRTYSFSQCFFLTFNTCKLSLSNAHCQAIFDQLKAGPVIFKLDIRFLHALPTTFPALNTSLVVNMGEGRSDTLLVNKHILAGMSSYFSNLFREQDGNNNNEFQLNETDDFDIEAFKWMLYAAMTMGWVVQEPNCFNSMESVRIIKLGVNFDMALMVHYCERCLLNALILLDLCCPNCLAKSRMTSQYSKMELLELADQFSLDQLKEHCLNDIGLLDLMENFGKITEIQGRLSKATQERLQEKFKENAQELRASTMALGRGIREDRRRYRGLVDQFNELSRAMWGEKASTIEVADDGSTWSSRSD